MNKKKIITTVIAVAAIVAVFVGVLQWKTNGGKPDETPTPEPTASAIAYVNDPQKPEGEYVLDDATIEALRTEVNQGLATNQDVQGVLYFPSGLVHKTVLKGTDNNYYLYHNWQNGADDPVGSATMDAWNNIDRDDMNTIIYGHFVYPSYSTDRTLAFTRLDELLDQANYEANKYVCLVTANDIRYYQVARVFNCPLETINGVSYPVDDLQYNLETYYSDYFDDYMNASKNIQLYDTGVDIEYGDRLLTLQTCLNNNDVEREVVLCKELGRETFTD